MEWRRENDPQNLLLIRIQETQLHSPVFLTINWLKCERTQRPLKTAEIGNQSWRLATSEK